MAESESLDLIEAVRAHVEGVLGTLVDGVYFTEALSLGVLASEGMMVLEDVGSESQQAINWQGPSKAAVVIRQPRERGRGPSTNPAQTNGDGRWTENLYAFEFYPVVFAPSVGSHQTEVQRLRVLADKLSHHVFFDTGTLLDRLYESINAAELPQEYASEVGTGSDELLARLVRVNIIRDGC